MHDHVRHDKRERTTAAGGRLRRTEEELESHLRRIIVATGPEQAFPLFAEATELVTRNRQLQHLAGRVDLGRFDRPRCFHVDAWADRAAGEGAEPQHDALLVRPHDHQRAQGEQDGGGKERQRRHGATEHLIEPAA